jgi:hypothetical protein
MALLLAGPFRPASSIFKVVISARFSAADNENPTSARIIPTGVRRFLRSRFLPALFVDAILDGTRPVNLTAEILYK